MFCLTPLLTAKEYIKKVNDALIELGKPKLTIIQRLFFAKCITGIIITNSVCWAKIERSSFGHFCAENLSKMFRRKTIPWESLLIASTFALFKEYGITAGTLVLDDTDNKRSKRTKKISKAHKIKDKASGGFVNGQELLFLLLVTDKVTIPVGMSFYEPDPDVKEWKKKDRILKSQSIAKKDRPAKPAKNSKYPTKQAVALKLIDMFKKDHPQIKISAILADALYGSSEFVGKTKELCPDTQVISQIKSKQLVKMHGKYISVDEYFDRLPGVKQTLKVRGDKEKTVIMHGARLYLKAHGCKRFIIALKYDGEDNYRYLLASDLTWRLTDIASAYTLRWLVEVFFQDWKSYEGWCQLAKQPGDEGSCRGVILSLLTDHCLLSHPDQIALIKSKLPAATVGSLRDRERAKGIIASIEDLLHSDHAEDVIQELKKSINNVIPLQESSKHMNGRDLGRMAPTPSLRYKAAA